MIEDYLDARIQIKIKDQRSFIGSFKCVDSEANIILSETVEILNGE
jgi:small nuclear ribonucleoprotein (snRNP)-like protein